MTSRLCRTVRGLPSRRPSLVARWLCLVGLVPSLAGCIVMARTAEVYDPQCRTYVKQVVLEAEAIGSIGHCHNDGCATLLAAMGIVSAASAVVAGSVAIVGNIAYWVERKGQCPPDAPPVRTTPTPTERP